MRRLALATLALATVACQQPAGRSPEGAPATPPTASAAPLDLDLSQVIDRVRRGVRRDGDRLVARGDHHQLSVEATGRVRVTALGAGGAGLSLETAAITRGGRPLAGGALARADGATVVVARGAVEEQLENRAGGVEQRWRLATRPPGAGDLIVSVRASGLAWAGATAGGLHFGDPAAGGLVRYGPATWVDAAGARTPLATRFAAGTIQITVPAAALDGAAYPAVIDPVVSAERAVDQPPGGTGASGLQVKPSVACLASGTCLVAWQDQVTQTFGLGTQLRGARVSGSPLTLLDPNGFDIDPGSATSDCGVPIALATAASTSGGAPEFAVVYAATDQLGGGAWQRRLKVARVSAAGALVGPVVQLSDDANGNVGGYDAASDGSTVAALWSDAQEIRFRTFASGLAGAVVPPPVPRASAGLDGSLRWDRPAIAWTGTDWFLAWRDTSGAPPSQWEAIRVLFLTSAGAVVSGAPSGNYLLSYGGLGLQGLSQPVVAADGAGHVLAMTTARTGGDPYPGVAMAFRFSRTAADWTAWDLGTIPNIWGNNEVTGLSAWWNGASFSVLAQYQVSGGQSAVVKTFPATPFTTDSVTPVLPLGTTQLFPTSNVTIDAVRATPDGANLPVLVWEDRTNGGADVRAARLAGPDPRPASLLLTSGAADEGTPAAAYDSGVWLVAWDDQRTVAASGAADLFAVRLARTTGAALDATALHLSAAPGFQGGAVASGGGGGFLVAWADGRALGNNTDLYATRVTPSGVVSFPAGVGVATETTRNELPVAAAFDGADFHLLYTSEDQLPVPGQVLRDARLQPADLLTRGTIDVATPADPNRRLHGALACRSSGCLAAWSEELGTTISTRGIVGGAMPGAATTLVTGLSQPIPAVSAAATGAPPFLVAWAEPNFTTQTTTVNGRLAGGDGASLGAVTLGALPGTTSWVTASFDGLDHVVSWSPDSGGLAAGWIQASGTARASATSLATGGLTGPRAPTATAGDGEGRTLIASSAFDSTAGVRARRVKVRLTSWSKLPGDPCTLGAECGTGFCVEGVCCDSACGGGANSCQTCSARNGHGIAGHCAATLDDACNDGLACTSGDRCTAAAACVGTSYSCTATQCQASSSCDGLGGCTVANKPDTTACDDGNPCTYADQCGAGACAGTAITCTAGSCDVSSTCNGTSACTVTRKPDNASCSDGDPCTQNDTCQSGSCVPGSPKVCPALADPCKGAGSCDPASGGCAYAAAPDGTTCDAGTCQGGACQAGPGAVLGMSCGSGPAGGEALLLGLALLGLLTRRAGRRS